MGLIFEWHVPLCQGILLTGQSEDEQNFQYGTSNLPADREGRNYAQ